MTEVVPKAVLWAKLESSHAFGELLTKLSTDIEREKAKFFDMEGNASPRELESQRLKVKHYREFMANIKKTLKNAQTGRKA